MATERKIALVSGANKGLGFEIAKQLAENNFKVILTARDSKKGEAATQKLKADGHEVVFCRMDIANSESVKKAAEFVQNKFGRLDVLVNNAGIFLKEDRRSSALAVGLRVVWETFETNAFGHFLVLQAFIPIMKKNGYGRIINVSSSMGVFSKMKGEYLSYRLSKSALNALTRIFAEELEGTNILINSMCPGWCYTDMGGPNAERSPEEGARTAIYLAILPDGGPSGKYFKDEKEIAWQ